MAGSTEYKNNWQKENLDRISLTVPKGQKQVIQAHAQAHNESVNSFINHAIREAIERDLGLDDGEKEAAVAKDCKVAAEDQDKVKTPTETSAALSTVVDNTDKSVLSELTQSGRQHQVVIVERDSMRTNK